MSRKKIVAGNWKMNCTLNEAIDIVRAISNQVPSSGSADIILFPPFPFLQTVTVELQNKHRFSVGGQNCSEHVKGAFTGEVSAAMLASVGCRYVLIGHSERRTCFSESSAQLVGKIRQAHASNLHVVFCFGEQLNERKNNLHFDTVGNQLREVLQHISEEAINNLVLAYEPVWAIGTGETATPAQAEEMHAFVRRTIGGIFSAEAAQKMTILYGGSCNAQNAAELFSCPNVDGGLIGGASLKAEDFCKIIGSMG